jgi:prepilin-type N-terminal cleavage/methylation domain-containing protein
MPQSVQKSRFNTRLSGFTLIELVMVMILVSLLAVTAISRWSATPFDVATQAEQLLMDIRYVQTLAMSHGKRYRINFAANSYSFSNLDGSVLMPHPATNNTTTLLANGVTLSFSNTLLVFNGYGTPYSNATLPGTALVGNATVTLSSGADSRTIQISPETGRAVLL